MKLADFITLIILAIFMIAFIVYQHGHIIR
jgi:hypothetical protein